MSSQRSSNFEQGAVIVANELASGRTVFMGEGGAWRLLPEQAAVITSEEQSAALMRLAHQQVEDCRILDPYLVATDVAGRPLHIRERIRFSPSLPVVNDAVLAMASVA